MAEAVEDGLFKLTQVMASLRTMTETKGVSTSVIKDDNKVKPTLDSAEQSRLREIAKVIGSVLKVGAYEDKPEATRLGDLTPSTTTSKVLANVVNDKAKSFKPQQQSIIDEILKNTPTWAKALGVGGILGGLAYVFKDKIASFWREHGDSIKETVGKLLGNLSTAIKENFGLFWTTYGDDIKESIKSVFKHTFDAIFSVLGFAWNESSASSKVRLASQISSALPASKAAITATQSFNPPVSSATKAIQAAEDTSWLGKTKSFFGKGVTKVKTAAEAGVDYLKNNKVTRAIEAITEKLPKLYNSLKGVGAIGKVLRKILKIPFLAQLVEAGVLTSNIMSERTRYNNGEIDLATFQSNAGAMGINSLGGIVGSALGGVAGGTLSGAAGIALAGATGGILTPIIPYLTGLGSVGGAFVGDWLGRKLGNFASEYALTDENKRASGEYLTNWAYSDKAEMQDFIIKNGQVFKFSSKDDVLGMKKGGAVDSLFSNLTQEFARDNAIIRDASIAQVNKLDDLIAILSEYLKRSNNRVTPVDTSVESIPNKPFDIRKRFAKQTLIPTQPQLY